VHVPEISYPKCWPKSLGVMDASAVAMCRDNQLPILVFNLNVFGNIMRMAMGEPIGTLIHHEHEKRTLHNHPTDNFQNVKEIEPSAKTAHGKVLSPICSTKWPASAPAAPRSACSTTCGGLLRHAHAAQSGGQPARAGAHHDHRAALGRFADRAIEKAIRASPIWV
jgi:hypothetical protein